MEGQRHDSLLPRLTQRRGQRKRTTPIVVARNGLARGRTATRQLPPAKAGGLDQQNRLGRHCERLTPPGAGRFVA